MPSKASMAAPFQSKEAFVDFLRTSDSNGTHTSVGDARWSNKDLEPYASNDKHTDCLPWLTIPCEQYSA